MITISIDPVIFSIGHIMIRWYSIIVTFAIGVGVWIAWREAKRRGLAEKHFNDAILWVIVAGLIGARLFHVLDHWPHEYAANPIRALYIWEGGLAIWGAVGGGVCALSAPVLFPAARALSAGVLRPSPGRPAFSSRPARAPTKRPPPT